MAVRSRFSVFRAGFGVLSRLDRGVADGWEADGLSSLIAVGVSGAKRSGRAGCPGFFIWPGTSGAADGVGLVRLGRSGVVPGFGRSVNGGRGTSFWPSGVCVRGRSARSGLPSGAGGSVPACAGSVRVVPERPGAWSRGFSREVRSRLVGRGKAGFDAGL